MNKLASVDDELYLVQTVDESTLAWFSKLDSGSLGKPFFYDRKLSGIVLVNAYSDLIPVTTDGPVSRDEHFARINTYPSRPVVGERWEIGEEEYFYFLEVLPPMRWRKIPGGSSFCMSEFQVGNITSQYSEEYGRYFHEFVELDSGAKGKWEMEYYG